MTTEQITEKAIQLFNKQCEYREFIGCGSFPVLTAGEAVILGLEMYKLGKEDQE